jgi:hypothetical protein
MNKKTPMITIGKKPIDGKSVPHVIADECVRLSKTPEWQQALLRMHTDKDYTDALAKELDDEFDSEFGTDSQSENEQ